MTAVILTGTCCGLVACNTNGNNSVDVTSVIGEYNGSMSILNIAPFNGKSETPDGAQINVIVAGDSIKFEDFPIRDLVKKVSGDDSLTNQIVEKIGKVNYSIAYAALSGEDGTYVDMLLAPEPLKLTLPVDSEDGEKVVSIEIEITPEKLNYYTIDLENLVLNISCANIKLADNELSTFEPFTLAFNMVKK